MNQLRRRGIALPTPRQIANAPEIAILRAIEIDSELVVRALIAAHPEIEGNEVPYWAANNESDTNHLASKIVDCAIKMRTEIDDYFRAVEAERMDANPNFEDELPF